MTEDFENTEIKPDAAEETPAPSLMTKLKKFMIPGAIGIGAIVITAVVMTFVMGGGEPAPNEEAAADSTAHASAEAHQPADGHATPAKEVSHSESGHESADASHADDSQVSSSHHPEVPQSLIADGHEETHMPESMPEVDALPQVDENDPKVIDDIMQTLAFLDYQPEDGEIPGVETGMSAEDSAKEQSWLDEEKAKLDEREEDLQTRERALAEQRRELDRIESDVNKKLLKLEQAETTRINALAKLYDGMDPRSVVQLVNNLDDATVVALLPRMKTKNASAVMALMSPKRAARLSKQMITITGK